MSSLLLLLLLSTSSAIAASTSTHDVWDSTVGSTDPDDFFIAAIKTHLAKTGRGDINVKRYAVSSFTEMGSPLEFAVVTDEDEEMAEKIPAHVLLEILKTDGSDKKKKDKIVDGSDKMKDKFVDDSDKKKKNKLDDEGGSDKTKSTTTTANKGSQWRAAATEVGQAVETLRDTGNPMPLLATCASFEGLSILLLLLVLAAMRHFTNRLEGLVGLVRANAAAEHGATNTAQTTLNQVCERMTAAIAELTNGGGGGDDPWRSAAFHTPNDDGRRSFVHHQQQQQQDDDGTRTTLEMDDLVPAASPGIQQQQQDRKSGWKRHVANFSARFGVK